MSSFDSSRPIAVFGATGAQGGPVARALLDAGRPVRAIARTPEKLAALAERGAETSVVDLADAGAVRAALEGVAGAFLHLPFVPVEELIRALAGNLAAGLIDAAVPSAVFTLSGPPAATPIGVASFDTKAVAKQVLVESGARVVGFEPMLYLGNLAAFFSAPSVVFRGEVRYPLPAEHRHAWISVEDQAALAIAALERPDLAGRWFRIGERLTGPEIAAGIGEGLGRDVRYVGVPPEEFWPGFTPVMGEEFVAALTEDYAGLNTRPEALDLDADTSSIRSELGVKSTPVAEWARSQDWQSAAAILGEPA